MISKTSYFVFSFFLLVLATVKAQTYGKHGMVVSDDAYASQVGITILQKGGNAIDAAVATAFALSVTLPQAGNIGGGGFMVYMPKNRDVTTIDFREKAPLLATEDMFLNEDGILIPGSNHTGLKSVGVPGTVAGLYLAHQKYGKLLWRDVVQPSVDLAQNGVSLSYTLATHAKSFSESDAPVFLNNLFRDESGTLLDFGALWKQPALDNTLALIKTLDWHQNLYIHLFCSVFEAILKHKCLRVSSVHPYLE